MGQSLRVKLLPKKMARFSASIILTIAGKIQTLKSDNEALPNHAQKHTHTQM